MPENIPGDVVEESHKEASAGAWVWLLDINIGGDVGTLTYVNNSSSVTILEGQSGETTYSPLPFELGPWEQKENSPPTRTISIVNETLVGTLLPYMEDYNGLEGKSILVTPLNLLFPDADMSEKTQSFIVVSGVSGERRIDITLGAISPLSDSVPSQILTGLFCRYVRRFKQAPCNYSGAETTCNGTYKQCCDYGNEARFGGIVGLESRASKYVK